MERPSNGEKQKPGRIAQITITYDFDSGFLEVNGPMQDRVLFYGLLELARDVAQEKAKPSLVAPTEEQTVRATRRLC